MKRLETSGADVCIRQLPSDTGIPVLVCLIRSDYGLEHPFHSGGFGCHVDAEIAAARALTEAIQSRNALIQGSREDIPELIGSRVGPAMDPLLWKGSDGPLVPFGDLPSVQNRDILDDIHLMLDGIKGAGIQDVYVVDLSRTEIPASVVKVIVPDFETWFLNDFDRSRCNLGWRAKRALQEHLSKGSAGPSEPVAARA